LTALTIGNAASNSFQTSLSTLQLINTLSANFPTTLTVNLPAGASGVISDVNNKFTTLNVVATDSSSGGAALSGFQDTNIRTLNISGTGTVVTVDQYQAAGNTTPTSGNQANVDQATSLTTALTAFTATGSVGVRMDLSRESGITAITMGNTGENRITVNAAVQSYTGGTGLDRVQIGQYPTKIINGGGGASDIIVLNLGGGQFTTANAATTATNLLGFSVLGTNTGSSGTFDMSTLPSSITAIRMFGTPTGTTTFDKVVPGTPLTLEVAITQTTTYRTSDFNGAANSLNITLTPASASSAGTTGGATTTLNQTGTLILNDQVGGGLGSVTLNSTATVNGALTTFSRIVDPGLSNLTINGSSAYTFTLIDGSTTLANTTTNISSSSLNIVDNSTSTAVNTITTLNVGAAFSQLSYSGGHTAGLTITNLINGTTAGAGAAGVAFTNTNTGSTNLLTIGVAGAGGSAAASLPATYFVDSAMTTLRLSGSVVAYVNDTNNTNSGMATVIGSTDNAQVVFNHSGAVAAAAGSSQLGDVVTLGNGGTATTSTILTAATTNQVITGAGQDTITVGSGWNVITPGAAADTVTFGSHGGVDALVLQVATAANLTTTAPVVGFDTGFIGGTSLTTAGTGFTYSALTSNSVSTTNFDIITGLRAGDVISFSAGSGGYTVANGTRAAATNLALAAYDGTNAIGYFTNATALVPLDNGIEMVRGIYNAVTQTFNGSATGTDTLFVFDANATVTGTLANSTAYEAIVLVGYAATGGSSATLGTGQVTLA